MYTIEKQQTKIDNFKINNYYFKRARDSFEYILTNILHDKKILIPAYIGYSSNEGSGIFDPIKNSDVNYEFYKLQKDLNIDKNFLFKLMDANENSVLLLVHYFGFMDINIEDIKSYAKRKNIKIVEDCAHSFFTFFKAPLVDSEYYIFSLHKMFSYTQGGMLISKDTLNLKDSYTVDPFEYNLFAITNKRVQNYEYLVAKLELLTDIKILRPTLNNNVPQTLPVLVQSEEIRDNLYFKLNEFGFGVVSLYHELIKEVNLEIFQSENHLSKHILNFPIHQDISLDELDKMVQCILNNKLLKSSI